MTRHFASISVMFFSLGFSEIILACSITFNHPDYISINKLYGPKIEGLEYDPISHMLKYQGDIKLLSVYVKKDDALEKIAIYKAGILCDISEVIAGENKEENCQLKPGFAPLLSHYLELEKRRVRENIFIQIDSNEIETYRLKNHWVRNTKELKRKAEGWAYTSICGQF